MSKDDKVKRAFFLGHSKDDELYSIREVKNRHHLIHLRNHCLRQGKKYNDVKFRRITMRNENIQNHVTQALHIVFEAYYAPLPEVTFSNIELRYRELTLAMSMDRVIAPILSPEQIYTVTMVSGENVTADGERYEMVPALHMLLSIDTPDEDVELLINGLYGYMEMHGYMDR